MYANTLANFVAVEFVELPSLIWWASQVNTVSFVRGAKNYHNEIKILATQQDKHQQRTFKTKSNVESATVEN